jgi:hypothetical protein
MDFAGCLPRLYPSVPAMLEQGDLDFVYVHGANDSLNEISINLLVEDPAPHRLWAVPPPDKCVQVLPKYEFGGISGSSAVLSGNWTHAVVDCRSTLPATSFEDKSEFAFWLYREVAEAMDFVAEVMDITQAKQVFAAATPAVSAHQAKFGWRFVSDGATSRTIDLSVAAATRSSKARTGITITLTGHGQSIVLYAAPRSPRFTAFLIGNLVDALNNGNRQTLLYHPTVLKQSYDLVSQAAMSV